MTALETGLAGFAKTTFVNEFPAAGHHVTFHDGLNVEIGLTDETLVLED